MKTTIATKFPKHLLIAFEKGYNAIPGAMAQPINSWGEFKKILKELKRPEVKEKFETVIIDTADIAYDYCTKFVLSNQGVDKVSDIPFGAGYGMISKEFDECLRNIVQMDYGLVLISHATDKTFTDEKGKEYNKIVPTLDKRATNIVSRMADIIGYSRAVELEDGTNQTMLFMRGTSRFMAGSRFKYTPDYIEFTYKNLVEAIGDALDKQMEEDGTDFFTDERSNLYKETTEALDFDALMDEFSTSINNVIASVDEDVFNDFWQPRIVEITDKHLGKGKKVNQISRDQVEALDLIVSDLKDLIEKNK